MASDTKEKRRETLQIDRWMDGWIDGWVDGGLVNDERDAGGAKEKVGVEEAMVEEREMLSRMEGLKEVREGMEGGMGERRRLERLCFKLVTPWINRQVLESA